MHGSPVFRQLPCRVRSPVLIGQCVAGHKHRKFASVQPRIVYRRLCWSPLKAGTGAPRDIQPLAWAKYASERHNYFRYSITVCVDTVMQRMCYWAEHVTTHRHETTESSAQYTAALTLAFPAWSDGCIQPPVCYCVRMPVELDTLPAFYNFSG